MHKGRTRYYAEGLREIGVLIIVFGPMYSVFETGDTGLILAAKVLCWLFGGLFVFHIGVEIERRAR